MQLLRSVMIPIILLVLFSNNAAAVPSCDAPKVLQSYPAFCEYDGMPTSFVANDIAAKLIEEPQYQCLIGCRFGHFATQSPTNTNVCPTYGTLIDPGCGFKYIPYGARYVTRVTVVANDEVNAQVICASVIPDTEYVEAYTHCSAEFSYWVNFAYNNPAHTVDSLSSYSCCENQRARAFYEFLYLPDRPGQGVF